MGSCVIISSWQVAYYEKSQSLTVSLSIMSVAVVLEYLAVGMDTWPPANSTGFLINVWEYQQTWANLETLCLLKVLYTLQVLHDYFVFCDFSRMNNDSDGTLFPSDAAAEKIQRLPMDAFSDSSLRSLACGSIIAGLVTSFIGWSTLYYLLCTYSLRHTSEWHCRLVTVLHAVTVVILSGWCAFVQGPWPFTDPGMYIVILQTKCRSCSPVNCDRCLYRLVESSQCTVYVADKPSLVYDTCNERDLHD